MAKVNQDDGVMYCLKSDVQLFFRDIQGNTPLDILLEGKTNQHNDCIVETMNYINQKQDFFLFDLTSKQIHKMILYQDPRMFDFFNSAVKSVKHISGAHTKVPRYREFHKKKFYGTF